MNHPLLARAFAAIIFVSLTFCASAVAAGEQVRLVSTPEAGLVPDAEIDEKGVVHLTYVKAENAFYARSQDGGQTFGAPIRINSESNSVHPANMFRGPDLAIGKDGRVHVIWYVNAYQRKLPQNEWGVFYSYLDRGGKSFVPARNLNHKPSDNYSLAADAKGRVAVVWMAEKLHVTSSTDNGQTFSSTVPIPNADPCECCASRAMLQDGTLLISYRDKTQNSRDMHLLMGALSGTVFANEKVSSTPWQINACPMTGTFLAPGNNEVIIGWETKGSVYFGRRGLAREASTIQQIKVAAQGKWPIALINNDGVALVSWKSGEQLHWQLFDRSGRPIGEARSKPSDNGHRHAGVVSKRGTFLLID